MISTDPKMTNPPWPFSLKTSVSKISGQTTVVTMSNAYEKAAARSADFTLRSVINAQKADHELVHSCLLIHGSEAVTVCKKNLIGLKFIDAVTGKIAPPAKPLISCAKKTTI